MGNRLITKKVYIKTCDLCNGDLPNDSYSRENWVWLKDVICYGWKKNERNPVSTRRDYQVHTKCVGDLIHKTLVNLNTRKD